MNIALAIFGKTVGLSPVKTRLAADIGRAAAEEFYNLSVSCVAETALLATGRMRETLSPVWVLAEENGPESFCNRTFPSRWTGEGGLGSRLANVSDMMLAEHDGVIMIGTDSPQMGFSRIVEAVSALSETPGACIAGRALDGGFYLFGSMEPVPREIWEQVSYSRDTTLEELSGLLENDGRKVVLLDVEQDVDVVEDLKILEKSLSEPDRELASQQVRLLDWLRSHRTLF